MRRWAPPFLVFLFLILTNRYYSTASDSEYITRSAGDVWDYQAIADAAPALPKDRYPYHHSQRFALPLLAGLIGKVAGIPNEWVMRGIV